MKTKLLIAFVVGIFLISLISAAEVSYCCEKIKGGEWCGSSTDPQEECDNSYRNVPTSCESTSYCKLGTCVDSSEGTCIDNTYSKKCEDDDGVWYDKDSDELPQCELGCCLMGDQAAFVTQSRCKIISAKYGLETDFRKDISTEFECIASTTSNVIGACVFEKDYTKTCLFLTQKECAELEASSGETEVEFHKDYLCSAESLGTNCGRSDKTTCIEGKDGVYFVDTCGNVANIYDSLKKNSPDYWTKVYDKEESCNADDPDGNANSAVCGNCDYYLGSTCKTYSRSKDKVSPRYGDNICRDLSCEYEGKNYEHGETWCVDSDGADKNLPGSRHFRAICFNGEVSIEPCADFRNEVCLESEVNGFRAAGCRVNQWQDCVVQDNRKDCENEDRRDCVWVSSSWKPKEGDIPGIIKTDDPEDKNAMWGACVPKYQPGFNFWEEGSAEEICNTASMKCNVVFEEGLISGKECIQNCECLTKEWEDDMNKICTSMGDCGSKRNYIGVKGYHDEDAYYSGNDKEGEE